MKPAHILFAHGAGAPSSSEWMSSWRQRLSKRAKVTTFDYPYMARGIRRPDPMPKLMEAHVRAIEAALLDGERLVLAGKSMGSRVGCHVAAAGAADPSALICFGYPLVGASGKRALRDQVLLELSRPILFLQGDRDKLCPLEELEKVRARMKAPSVLHVVPGGDHSLRVGKRALKAAGETQEDVDCRVADAVQRFLAAHVS